MPDVFDTKKRSEVMSGIRSKNTRAEKITFSYLRKHNVYFQRHYKGAVGTPDIALPRKKRAVFIDSDFWHGRTLRALKVRRANIPNDHWVKKIEKNVERDKRQRTELKRNGWRILVIWEEHIIRKSTRDINLERIREFLTADYSDSIVHK